jgi:hypothetical protein
MAYAVGPRQRPVLMATLGGIASIGAIISPTAVGLFMDAAGYRTPEPGKKDTIDMIAHMTDGVHQSFGVAGTLLVVAGVLSMAFLNPDRTGRRLQEEPFFHCRSAPRGVSGPVLGAIGAYSVFPLRSSAQLGFHPGSYRICCGRAILVHLPVDPVHFKTGVVVHEQINMVPPISERVRVASQEHPVVVLGMRHTGTPLHRLSDTVRRKVPAPIGDKPLLDVVILRLSPFRVGGKNSSHGRDDFPCPDPTSANVPP